jgi:hypothetical protein
MVDNKYLDVLITAVIAIIFIIISSYGLGLFARFIAKLTGASRKQQENTLRDICLLLHGSSVF